MKILKSINLYALLLFVLVLIVSLSVVNISAPLTEGWWHVYARWIDQGRIPYRDFELLVPPGYPYLIWLLTHIVGEQFLHLRILGCLLESAIAVQLFYIFKGLIGKFMGLVLAFFGAMYLYSGIASITYDYHYFAIFFLLGAGLFLQKSNFFATNVFSKADSRLYVMAGICIALSSLIKQTYAISFALFIFFYFAVRVAFKFPLWKILLNKLAYLLLPWISVLGFVTLYFSLNGAFSQMLQQIFLGALEVKGSTNNVAFEWLKGLWNPYWISYNLRSIAVFVFACFMASTLSKRRVIFGTTPYSENLILTFAIGAFTAVLGLIRLDDLDISHGLPTQIWQSIHEVMFLAPLMVLFYMFLKFSNLDSPWAPLMVLAFAFAWGNGMSAGLTEYGTFLSSMTAFAFISWSFGSYRIIAIFTLIIVFITSTAIYSNRLAVPYSWWGYTSPSAKEATVTSGIGLTKGLKFSKKGYTEFQEIHRRLSNLPCRGEVIGYPHMPLFALDADRLPQGRAAVYWFDFIKQTTLISESARLKDEPLGAFLFMGTGDAANIHKKLFKIQNNSGRSQLLLTINETKIDSNQTNYPALKLLAQYCPDLI